MSLDLASGIEVLGGHLFAPGEYDVPSVDDETSRFLANIEQGGFDELTSLKVLMRVAEMLGNRHTTIPQKLGLISVASRAHEVAMGVPDLNEFTHLSTMISILGHHSEDEALYTDVIGLMEKVLVNNTDTANIAKARLIYEDAIRLFVAMPRIKSIDPLVASMCLLADVKDRNTDPTLAAPSYRERRLELLDNTLCSQLIVRHGITDDFLLGEIMFTYAHATKGVYDSMTRPDMERYVVEAIAQMAESRLVSAPWQLSFPADA